MSLRKNISYLLFPLTMWYAAGVRFRNIFYALGLKKQEAPHITTIGVGNLSTGGTGKTPHVEYLLRLLSNNYSTAMLSRGYKRKSKGFILADKDTTMPDIGDEPYQMKQKFPSVTIAVDKNRCHGIDLLTENDQHLDVILLDDAFQHRYVKPGINILLVDYHRLIIYDKLLPAGRLREPLSGKNRADIVIVTKCPKDLKPMEFRVITKAMSLYPYQQLFFTTLEYSELQKGFPNARHTEVPQLSDLKDTHVLLLTGIASPEQMVHDLTPYCDHLSPLTFSDHHQFRKKDIRLINESFAALPSPKCIITTEKDATRLQNAEELSDEVKAHLYILPVRICFMQEQENIFNHNSRNSILAQVKNDNKPKDSHRSGDWPRTISFRNN